MKTKRLSIGFLLLLSSILFLASCANSSSSGGKRNCGGDVCYGAIAILTYRK